MSSENSGAKELAERYAAALFALAEGGDSLDRVATDLIELKKMIADAPDLRRVIRSPVLNREVRAQALAALADKAGFGDLVRRFLGVVAANRRSYVLVPIIDAFLARLAARRGEITADVTAAHPLTPEQTRALDAALKSTKGDKIVLNLRIDPTLLGGLIVKVGSRMVDSSLRTKLQHLQLAMKGIA